MNDCIFCKIIKGEVSSQKVYEDDRTFAFLDITPINPGHTLVVPKKHSLNMLDAAEGDVCAIMAVIHKITPKILKAVGAEAFNLGANNGSVAGQIVPHLHFHIMPRFSDDGHRLWGGSHVGAGDLEKVAEKIRKEF